MKIPYFPQAFRVVDAGTDTFFLVLLFVEIGNELAGIDLSESYIRAKHVVESTGLEINFSYGNTKTRSFEDRIFLFACTQTSALVSPQKCRNIDIFSLLTIRFFLFSYNPEGL